MLPWFVRSSGTQTDGNIRSCRIEGVGCGHGVVVVGVTRPMLRGVRRGGELHENGRALDGVRASQAGRGDEPLGCGCIRRPVVGPPGAPASRYAACHRFGRSLSVQSERKSGRRVPTPCHFQHVAHWGPCGKTPVVLQNLRPKPVPAEIGDSRTTCARGCAPPDRAEQLAGIQPC